MSEIFIARSFFAFTKSRQAIYYPLFLLPGYNIPFVQITDQNGLISCFSEFPTTEDLDFVHIDDPYLTSVGDAFQIGFFDLGGYFRYGVPKDLWKLIKTSNTPSSVAPLIEYQLSRMVGIKLFDSDSVWKSVTAKYLTSEKDSRLYVTTELAVEYNSSTIWNLIDAEKPEPTSIFNQDNEFSKLSQDDLFLWLSRNPKDKRWPQAWLLLYNLTKGVDDRVWNMGLDYILKDQSTDSPISTLNQAVIVSLTSSIKDLNSTSSHFVEYLRDLLIENQQFVEQNVLSDVEFRWLVRISLVGGRYAAEDIEYLSDMICKSRISFPRLGILLEILLDIMQKNPGVGSTDEFNDLVHRSAYFDTFAGLQEYRTVAYAIRGIVGPVSRRRGKS